MPDPETTDWRPAAVVALFGAVGGLTAWVWSVTLGEPLVVSTLGAVAGNVFFGMVAGFVGIYALIRDPSRTLLHSLALALLFGFVWKPTLEAGRELVISNIEKQEVAENLEAAEDLIAVIEAGDSAAFPAAIMELGTASEDLLGQAGSIRDPRLRREINSVVEESIRAIARASESAPEAGARALGTIGAAASGADRVQLSESAAGSLRELAVRKNFSPETAAEVSNSLMRMSAAARVEQREDAAQALRGESAEILDRSEALVAPQNRLEAERLRASSLVEQDLRSQRERRPPG